MNKDELINSVLDKLKTIPRVIAIVIGGSHASQTQRSDSDIDLGLFYRKTNPFSIELMRNLAIKLNDNPDPIVSDFEEWGHWVNGGTWLTIKGQRLDLIYRNLDFVERVIDDCLKGKIESDYYQEPPNGFHSFMYCAEIQADKILYDPEQIIQKLKGKVKIYPPMLKSAIINKFLWDTEFALSRARKFAKRNEIHLVANSLTRITHDLIQVVYAINETYFMSAKKAYKDIPQFLLIPNDFLSIIEKNLGSIGTTSQDLQKSLQTYDNLVNQCKLLAKNIYVPKYK